MPSDERVSDHRRINKPIMEKRRRARINDSLTQLKTLVLEGMKKDPARHSKLEKADILEMAVKHLKSLQTRPEAAAARYRDGYAQCRRQVAAYLRREAPTVGDELRTRLLAHLSGDEASTPTPTPTPAGVVPAISAGVGSLQLVPTSLPGGQLAFILPSPAAATVTAPTTLPLTVAVQSRLQQQQLQQLPAQTSCGAPSPAPSSPARAESGYDEPRSPASPTSSVGSCGYASLESTPQERPWSPQPLDLVAHNRGVEDTCWRPW